MPATLVWNGGKIRDRTAAAAALAVNRTMAEAVHRAHEDHPAYPPASDAWHAVREPDRLPRGVRPDP